jgi:TolB-like protein/Tfp pilus assembly protein PilF
MAGGVKNGEALKLPAAGHFGFEGFELDVPRRELRMPDGATPALPSRVFELLALLVANAGALLPRGQLLDTLWPGLVVEDNNLSQLVVALRRALGPAAARVQTVPRRGFRFVGEVRRLDASAAPAASAEVRTLAVLPFRPLVAAAADEVIEAGLADVLITRLSALAGLAVRSFASACTAVARTGNEPLQAARQLDAAWLLEGTAYRGEGRLRVSARLLDAATGTAAWSGRFDEPAGDLFAAFELIGARVQAVLAPQLGGEAAVAVAAVPADAAQSYLAARLHAQGLTPPTLARSEALFRQSLAEAPRFALAHAGLAETLRRQVFGADADPRLALTAARDAALAALALEPQLAPGHATLGWVAFWHDWDLPRAERHLRHAVALQGGAAEAHLALGHLLGVLGRHEQALVHLTQARVADPLTPLFNVMESAGLMELGHTEAARRRLDRALEIDPQFWIALTMRGSIELAVGDADRAFDTLHQAVHNSGGRTQAWRALGAALARAGRIDEAHGVLQRLQALAQERFVAPSALASLHAALGDTPRALDALEAAVDRRDTMVAYLPMHRARYPGCAGHPRLEAIVRRVLG